MADQTATIDAAPLPEASSTFLQIAVLASLAATGTLATNILLPSLPQMAASLNVSSAAVTSTITIFLAVFALGQFFLTRPLSVLHAPATVYWMTFGMAVFSTVLPIWLTNEGIRRIGAGRVAMIGTSGPIMTIGLGAIFLGEAITLFQLLGASLVIAGVIVVTFGKRT